MKILVTGFDPFGGEKINPAIESVKRLPEVIGGAQIVKLEIPTVVHQSLAVIREAIRKEDPDMILSIGQAGGRPDITVERVGINVDDCRIADNAGNQPVDEPIYPEGPDAYFVTLADQGDVKAMQELNSGFRIQQRRDVCLQPRDLWRALFDRDGISGQTLWFHSHSVSAIAGGDKKRHAVDGAGYDRKRSDRGDRSDD